MKARVVLSMLMLTGIAGCRPTDPVEQTSVRQRSETFQLPYGAEHTTASGMKLSFTELVQESRCPDDARCVWAGEAVIALQVTRGDVEMAVRATMPGLITRVDSTQAATIRTLGHTIQLLQLDPYPGPPVPPETYVAHLRVTRP